MVQEFGRRARRSAAQHDGNKRNVRIAFQLELAMDPEDPEKPER